MTKYQRVPKTIEQYSYADAYLDIRIQVFPYIFSLGTDCIQTLITGMLVGDVTRKHHGLTMNESAPYIFNITWPILYGVGATMNFVAYVSARYINDTSFDNYATIGWIFQAGVLHAWNCTYGAAGVFFLSTLGIYLTNNNLKLMYEIAGFLAIQIPTAFCYYYCLVCYSFMEVKKLANNTINFQIAYFIFMMGAGYSLLYSFPKLGWIAIGIGYALGATAATMYAKYFLNYNDDVAKYRLFEKRPKDRLTEIIKQNSLLINPLLFAGLLDWLVGLFTSIAMHNFSNALTAFSVYTQTYQTYATVANSIILYYGALITEKLGDPSIRVSQSEWNIRLANARKIIIIACAVGLLVSLCLAIFTCYLPVAEWIASKFLGHVTSETTQLAAKFLQIGSAIFTLDIQRKTLQAALFAKQDYVFPVVAAYLILLGGGIGGGAIWSIGTNNAMALMYGILISQVFDVGLLTSRCVNEFKNNSPQKINIGFSASMQLFRAPNANLNTSDSVNANDEHKEDSDEEAVTLI